MEGDKKYFDRNELKHSVVYSSLKRINCEWKVFEKNAMKSLGYVPFKRAGKSVNMREPYACNQESIPRYTSSQIVQYNLVTVKDYDFSSV